MRVQLLAAVLLVCAYRSNGQTMTVQSGQVIDLKKVAESMKGKCCVTVSEIGLGKVNGDQSIVRMDNSGGKYYTTNDPNCGNVIYSSSYPTSFQRVYLCGQCKGGCPQVDGGKVLVQPYNSCVKSDGNFDISKVCIASHPVCMSGSCKTIAEATAPTPAPTPAPVACASFSQLGQPCDLGKGQCCGGGPKNAKCENGKCVTTYPSGR